ncbi:ribosomal protein L7/L12 C-terminal domain-containing protein [Ephemerocybe angulata]|uniref:Ribosomal protein L7/L12 C-terminal domain-containing protein n=1 Tax=Ephemerocybe angulata TaxID=980116 RepID=A0A8H6MFX4_9AGAR|nr:ribosomal protein L7/L12 C-terminal domain-containing protein [Tulosesus angulatus]
MALSESSRVPPPFPGARGQHSPLVRWASTEAAASTSSSPALPPSSNPTINRIVDDISGLTLLQASDLVAQLKRPRQPAAAAPASDEPAAEKPKEKTVFNVMLESFDATAKPKVIREVKALVPNLTLIDAKKFVESLPKVLKENLSKEDAEKLKATFEAIGGVVKLD